MKKIYFLIVFLFLSACFGGRSDPARFYTIEAVSAGQLNNSFSQSIALTHIQLPKHLDRPQMVVFDPSDEQMSISEQNRWIEPLSNLMERVLIADLSEALPQAVIKQKLLANEKFDFFLSLDILELKTVFDEKITLKGWWILRSASGKIIKREKLDIFVPVGDDYTLMAQSFNKLLSEMAYKISQKIG